VEIDASRWRRVGGTNAGAYHEIDPGVLIAVPAHGYVQTEAGARASLVELDRISREAGRRHALIILVDRVRSQDKGSRRVWAVEADPHLCCCFALVCNSMLARAIGSFFMGLSKPVVPTRMFADLDQALAWSRSQVRAHGGPIDH
jgi:hypothetical protein